ncbi:MAG: biotin transporter BioY [Ignavibacteriales bacterium]|nr:biotin transporter BioY [Ignavibacteriales bacterium]
MQQAANARFLTLASDKTLIQAFSVLAFAIFTAIGAQVEIPHQPVPYTMQTLFVLLAGGMLGRRNGFLSMCAYLGLGLMGMPVFSGAGFGFARILGPTGGYLLAFPLAAFVVGYLVHLRMNFGWILASMLAGLLIIFTLGTVQLNFVYTHDWNAAFSSGFLIFSWWDAVKLVAAATIVWQYKRMIDKTENLSGAKDLTKT